LALNASAVSNSAQVVVEITPQVQLIGGVAQGFRAPNIEDFFGRVDFGQEIPNLGLKPERSTERQIGLRYQQAGTFLEAVAYQSDYQGLIDRTNTMTINGIANVRQRRNLGRAELQGVEVQYQDQGQDRHQPWSWGAHATYTRGEDASGQPLRRIPPLAGHLWARYQASAKLWLEAGLNSSDRQDRLSSGDKTDPRICPNGNSTTNPCIGTAGFAVFSLRGGYRFYPQHWLLLRAENINDQRYKTHGSGVFNAGRSVQVGYRGVF
jgi:outer membrane receptor protein involved in Fe transport